MLKMWILIMLAMLVICSISDIKTGYVNVLVVFIFVAAGIISKLFLSGLEIKVLIMDILYGIVPGIMVLAISLTMKCIGEGDAYIIMGAGALSGIGITLEALVIAFALSGVFSAGILLLRIKSLKDSFGFVPFLLVGYCLCIVLGNLRGLVV